MKTNLPLGDALFAHRKTLGALLAVVLLTNTFVVVARSGDSSGGGSLVADGGGAVADEEGSLDGGDEPGVVGNTPSAGSGAGSALPSTSPSTDVRKGKPGQVIKGKGTIPFGINGNELSVVYYWKGDQTKSSPFLAGTGQDGNVDEGQAFHTLIKYLNDNPEGEWMGFKYNLHGWKLKPQVLEAGKGDDQIRAAERISKEIKPFAAVSSHGSISAYVCPVLADAGIFNISTYDLDFGLQKRTNGYCLPAGIAFDGQADLTEAYMRTHKNTPYINAAGQKEERVYGVLYAEYPGMVNAGPKIVERLRKAGLNIPKDGVATVDPDLTTAGRQQPTVIAKFRGAGVNTIIAPESGSLITFTSASDGAGYRPDYYVWPCSGQDSLGMTRLYSKTQWERASGLTCYDENLNADLTNDDKARRTQWYKVYQEANPGSEPPAPTSLVYQSLLPLVVGITHAGRDLTIERVRAGWSRFKPYRYDAIKGRTNNPGSIMVTLNAPDGSQVGDAAKVYWDPTTTTPGNAAPGTYAFPENRRYARGARF